MTTDILCRYDARDQAPVVFLRDTIQGDKIQVWTGQGNPKVMPLDYYKMTSPLSAEDERVLMERYKQATGKQDQVIRITHRLPRTSRPVPNLLAAPNTGNTVNAQGENTQRAANAPRKPNAKAIEAQNAPAGPAGDLPKAGETPAPLPAATTPAATPAPAPVNERPSHAIWRQIEEANGKLTVLAPEIAQLQQRLDAAKAELATAQERVKTLSVDFAAAIQKETQEELEQRMKQLASLATVADPVAQFAQTLQDAGAKPVQAPQQAEAAQPEAAPAPAAKAPPKASNAPAKGQPRQSGKFAKKTPAPAKK